MDEKPDIAEKCHHEVKQYPYHTKDTTMEQIHEAATHEFGENIRVYPSKRIPWHRSNPGQIVLKTLGGLLLGALPVIVMIFFIILATNTSHINKHLSFQFYQMAISAPIVTGILSLIASIICACSKRLRLTGIVSLSFLISSVPFLLMMIFGLALRAGYAGG